MNLFRNTVFSAVLLLAGACASELTDPFRSAVSLAPGETALVTDRTEYVVRSERGWRTVDFALTYRNPLNRAVAVPSCGGPIRPMLQKLVDGEWVYAFSPVEPLCISAPLVIPARGVHSFRYQVNAQAHDLERWPGAASGSLDGTYRLRWWVGSYDRDTVSGVGTPLPLEHVVSNTFRLLTP